MAKRKRTAAQKKAPSIKQRVLLDNEVQDASLEARQARITAERRWTEHVQLCKALGRDEEPQFELEYREAVAAESEAEEELESWYWDFRITAISREKYRRLIKDHRPTAQQIEDHKDTVDEAIELLGIEGEESEQVRKLQSVLEFNPETFPRALFEVTIKPKPSKADLDALADEDGPFTDTELTKLLNQAIKINTETVVGLRG